MGTVELIALLAPIATYFVMLAAERLWPAREFPARDGWQWIGIAFLILFTTVGVVTPLLIPGAWLEAHRWLDGTKLGIVGGAIVGYVLMQPRNQTIPDAFDVYLSSPVVVGASVYFGSGDGNVYALDAGSGALLWKFQTGDVVHASPAYADGLLFFGSWDSWFYAVDAATGKEKWRFNNAGSWVITSPAVAQGKVIFGTSDSSLYYVLDAESGKALARQQGNAYMFSSPSVAGNVVLVGVLNGTLEARDLDSGNLLWAFETEASKQNVGWALTADRKFNVPMLFPSGWREATVIGTERQSSVGSIFSSPLIAGGVVYFGSTDGTLYAVE